MRALIAIAALAILSHVAMAEEPEVCSAAPPLPLLPPPADIYHLPPLPGDTDLITEVDPADETSYLEYVPAWLPAPYPECWVLGRVLLDYTNDGDPDTPVPLIYGVDVPAGEDCPAAAPAGCVMPNMWLVGIDFPRGTPCPPEALSGCYDPVPHPPAPAPPPP